MDTEIEFVHKLLSLSYFLKERSVLQTEWYIEDCPPDSSLYDPEGYTYWKVLSALNALTDNIIAECVIGFEDFLLYI